jgi:hypothetical protein
MRGASMKEVQELFGHKNMTMTLHYPHLGQEQKKQAVGLFNGLGACSLYQALYVTKVSQISFVSKESGKFSPQSNVI